MFLGGLKAKSILRKIKELNANRTYRSKKKPIHKVAIIQEFNKSLGEEELELLSQTFGVSTSKIMVLSYVKKPTKKQKENDQLFAENQVGWRGVMKTKKLKDFVTIPYDILLSYYCKTDLTPYAVTATSAARFKVGLDNKVEGLNDLVIYNEQMDFKTFITELKKYLHILKIAS